MQKTMISDIKRFAVHDGPGIRTTIFFKGCPLKCVWCHNPESICFHKEIAYYENKCISCGECVAVCPYGAHRMLEEKHVFNRDICKLCGKCAETCFGKALVIYGKEYTVEELLEIVLMDRDFYNNSGGGVTLSGGECLVQSEFCEELLRKCKENKIHAAVDTCGYVSKEALDRVIPYTDIFLYDIKAVDNDVHVKCTGFSNQLILENLRYLDNKGCDIEIRIPYVPKYNDMEKEAIVDFVRSLQHVKRVKILPYHNFAGSKYIALDMENKLPNIIPTKEEIVDFEQLL